MLELNRMVKPDSSVIPTELDILELENKETVLLNLETNMYYVLNNAGLRVWYMLGRGLTPGEICKRIQKDFDVPPKKVRESVLKLIDELITEKLVKVADG